MFWLRLKQQYAANRGALLNVVWFELIANCEKCSKSDTFN
jgi:hypothetical protein